MYDDITTALAGPFGRPDGRCPRCNSPSPERHPAVQFEEVEICSEPFHGTDPDYSAQVAEPKQAPRGPCASWPASPDFHRGYRDTIDVLCFSAALLCDPRARLTTFIEIKLRGSLGRTLSEADRGAIEALLWYWEKVLEQDDTTITIAAKALLYPEPVMGY